MLRGLSIAGQGMAIVILLLAIELFFVGAILVALQDARTKLANERHLVDVVTQSSHIGNMLQNLGTVLAQDATPAKLQQMVGKHESIKSIKTQIEAEFGNLEKLADNDPKILAIVQSQKNVLRDATKLYRADKAYYKLAKQDRIYSDTMLVMDDVSAGYRKLLEQFKTINQDAPKETSRSIASVKQLIYGGLILNLVAALTLALFFVKRVTSRISQLCDNMTKFQRNEPLPPQSSQNDEVGELDRMFRGMIASLEAVSVREKALIDGAYDVICTIDSSGNFTAVNAACLRQWGYEKSDLIGKHYSSIISPHQLSAVSHQLSRSRKMDAFVNFDTVVVKRGGEESDSSWSCFWSTDDDTNFCFVSDVSEINTLKRLLQACEEQIRDLMNNVPIALSVVDQKGTITFANKKMESLSRFTQDKLVGHNIRDLIVPGLSGSAGTGTGIVPPETHDSFDLDKFSSSFDLDQFSDSTDSGCLLKCSTGQKIKANVTVERLGDDVLSNEKAASVEASSDREIAAEKVVFIEDIEERVRLESLKREFIALLREKLRRPLVAVHDMVDKVSVADEHDTSAPTSAGAARVQKERVRITRILTSTNRLLRLIDELLNIESLEPGKLVGELQPTEVAAIVREAVDSLEDYANKQGIKIHASVCEGLILADAGRLTQVLINLISNAIKFSPGGSDVLVSAVDSGESVEFSVTDSGRGVPLSDQELIFKPYLQSTSDDAKKGTGLGLPICKAIVESHHGRIGVESGSESGSRFWFLIPKSGG